jgi:hypothetical protein
MARTTDSFQRVSTKRSLPMQLPSKPDDFGLEYSNRFACLQPQYDEPGPSYIYDNEIRPTRSSHQSSSDHTGFGYSRHSIYQPGLQADSTPTESRYLKELPSGSLLYGALEDVGDTTTSEWTRIRSRESKGKEKGSYVEPVRTYAQAAAGIALKPPTESAPAKKVKTKPAHTNPLALRILTIKMPPKQEQAEDHDALQTKDSKPQNPPGKGGKNRGQNQAAKNQATKKTVKVPTFKDGDRTGTTVFLHTLAMGDPLKRTDRRRIAWMPSEEARKANGMPKPFYMLRKNRGAQNHPCVIIGPDNKRPNNLWILTVSENINPGLQVLVRS